MTTLRAKLQGRRLVVEAPLDWPDDAEVAICPLNIDSDEMSPEEIARTLAAMKQIEPFDMTDEELDAWEAEREAQKARDKAEFFEHAEKLRSMWP